MKKFVKVFGLPLAGLLGMTALVLGAYSVRENDDELNSFEKHAERLVKLPGQAVNSFRNALNHKDDNGNKE